jgi:selenocysteine lyase/cysteine desulfurase
MNITASSSEIESHIRQIFSDFKNDIRAKLHIGRLSKSIIGKNAWGHHADCTSPVLYTDYAASGRALWEVENFVLHEVLPYYANPHTKASFFGRYMNAMRSIARQEVARFCGAGPQDKVIFAGNGATAGIHKLVHLFGTNQPGPSGQPALVILGPYEHHSNLLPWRESGAEVIELDEDPSGGPNRAQLGDVLAKQRDQRIICSFSAGSNVTGMLTDVASVSRLVHGYGGAIVWDYAGAAPYIPVQMQPADDVHLDAVVFSPHKMIGGPASSGVLVIREDAVFTKQPSASGGGTVGFVSPANHTYLADVSAREEAGTPNAIGDIRTALALMVRECMMQAGLDTRAEQLCQKARETWSGNPRIELLGCPVARQLPIVSFRIRDTQGELLHHQLATRILSDHFGIQARGGCACAGPYVHQLLDVDDEASLAIQREIEAGNELEKPGFVRVNFSSLMNEDEFIRLRDAVLRLADEGSSLARGYIANEASASFEPA